MSCRRTPPLIPAHRRRRFLLKVLIGGLLDGDADTLNCSALKFCWRLIFLAHGVGAVIANTKSIACQRELTELRPNRSFRHHLVVNVKSHLAEVLSILAFTLADKFHAERLFAGLECVRRDKVLLGRNAEKVINVVQLAILNEQRVSAEARAVREDHT